MSTRHLLEPRDKSVSASRIAVAASFATGCLVFLAVAAIVVADPDALEWMDDAMYKWVRVGSADKPAWFNEAVRDVSSLGSLSILIGSALFAVAYLLLLGRHRAAFHVIVATAGGIALGMGLKIPFDRARPDLLLHETQVFTRSFPSAHATASAAVLLTLGGLILRERQCAAEQSYIISIAITIILLIGASRIYLGVHWPSDVIAGWALGTAWACGAWLLMAGTRGAIGK